MVLGFGYPEGKTLKSHEYSSSFANINGNKKKIGVLCDWYILSKNQNSLLSQPMTTHGCIDICQYKMTISPPVISTSGDNLKIEDSIYDKVKTYF